ncbi:hypothetical protein C6558_23585 [Ensifer sp. NM-2]|nr:hypothetical protein C6558_23585 [Ensifer sp. NM-2]
MLATQPREIADRLSEKRNDGRTRADVGGVWTIGFGHLSAAGVPAVPPNMVITEASGEEILRAALAEFEERISRLGKAPGAKLTTLRTMCSVLFQ